MNVRVLLFDYGGVLAEEGFREGLFSIARQQGLEPDAFYKVAQEGVYDTGFVSGRGTEADFWRYMRDRFSLQGDDTSLSSEILQRFVLRQRMIDLVRSLRRRGYLVAMLSDQTVWLDQLDQSDRFYVAADLGLSPDKLVFIDDNQGNVNRARSRGINGIEFTSENDCLIKLEALLGQSLH